MAITEKVIPIVMYFQARLNVANVEPVLYPDNVNVRMVPLTNAGGALRLQMKGECTEILKEMRLGVTLENRFGMNSPWIC